MNNGILKDIIYIENFFSLLNIRKDNNISINFINDIVYNIEVPHLDIYNMIYHDEKNNIIHSKILKEYLFLYNALNNNDILETRLIDIQYSNSYYLYDTTYIYTKDTYIRNNKDLDDSIIEYKKDILFNLNDLKHLIKEIKNSIIKKEI